jgi:hypothetical protein
VTTGDHGSLGAHDRRTRRLLPAVAVGVLLLVPVAAVPAGWARAARAGSAAAAAVPVTLSPTTGVPGTVVQVAGSGFEPGARLLLRWDHGLGEVTATVAGDGTFQAALLIFRKDVVGPRRLLVEPAGQAAAATTEAPSTTEAPASSATTSTEATGTTLLNGAAAADATTFLVLPTRRNPALGDPASQGG